MFVAEGRRFGTDVADGLRGVAIAFVVLYHTWLFSWLDPHATVFGTTLSVRAIAQVGFLGVDLFFLISGFCLFYPHARAMFGEAPVPATRDFFGRRALKILPSYLLALVPAWLIARHFYADNASFALGLVEHVAFVHNLSVDWIGQVNGVFWSLAIEVQFYLLFPLVAWAFRRRPWLAFAAMLAVAFAFRWFAFGFLGDETRVRVLPAYLDVFAWGMLSAYVLVAMRRRAPLTSAAFRFGCTAAAIAATVAIVFLLLDLSGSMGVPNGRVSWELRHRDLLAALTFVVLIGSQLGVAAWRVLIVNPLTVALSVISYNLYLWHGAIEAAMYRVHLPPTAAADPHDDPLWQVHFIPLALVLAFLVAIAVTYLFERPLLGLAKPVAFAFPWPRLRSKARTNGNGSSARSVHAR